MNLEILNVLEGIYASKKLRRIMVPLFLSSPGQGKSRTIESFAKSKGKKVVKITLSQRMPNEVIGMLMPDLTNNKMVSLDSEDLLSLEDGDILFFDEMFNGTLKQTLDAVLNFLMDRVLMSGKPLADVMIVAASNPEGMIPLTPQIKERVIMYHIKYNVDDHRNYLKEKFHMPSSVAGQLTSLVSKEFFSDINRWNFNSARSIETAITSIGLGAPHPNSEVLIKILSYEIKLPIDLPEIEKNKGDIIPYLELLTEILKQNEEVN
jgi:hypothetical protein